MLRAIAAKGMGANARVQKLFYQAFIRSPMEYGSQAFYFRPHIVKAFQTKQNAALKLILHCPKNTSTQAIHVETGILPIKERFHSLLLNFIDRAHRTPNHPLIPLLQVYNSKGPDNVRRAEKKSWLICTSEIINTFMCTDPLTKTYYFPKTNQTPPAIKPWDQPCASFITNLPTLKKSDMDPNDLKTDSLMHIHSFPPKTIHVYTDGSVKPSEGKPPSAASAAILYFNPNNPKDPYKQVQRNAIELLSRIPDYSNTLQAELVAIKLALSKVLSITKNPQVAIHTDSLSSIQTLKKHEPTDNHTLVNSIHTILKSYTDSGGQVTFNWVPSHVGIPGNEKVDKLANKALELNHIDDIPISHGNARAHIKRAINNKYIEELENAAIESTSLERYLYISQGKPFPKLKITRKVEKDLIYLRIGYKFYDELKNTPLTCPECEDIFTITHYLVQCPHHTEALDEISNTLGFSDDPDSDPTPYEKAHKILQLAASRKMTPLIPFVKKHPIPDFNTHTLPDTLSSDDEDTTY